nr:MAG TPA: hypothetical protein [Caudoviricetes sp.]
MVTYPERWLSTGVTGLIHISTLFLLFLRFGIIGIIVAAS